MFQPVTQCTAVGRSGRDCDAPVAEDAPVSMCEDHIYKAFVYYRDTLVAQHGYAKTAFDPETRRFSEVDDGIQRGWIPGSDKPRTDVVYYIRFADRIKIGTTVNLGTRLSALPYDDVLATEPGGRHVEQQRHKEFADLRINGEWFTPGTKLIRHIEALREMHGIPVAGRRTA